MIYNGYRFTIYGNRLTISFSGAIVKYFTGKSRDRLIEKAKRYIDELPAIYQAPSGSRNF